MRNWCTAALLLAAPPLVAQQPSHEPPPPLTAAVRRNVVDSLAALVTLVYVDADTGRLIAERVRSRHRAGAYDTLTAAGDFGRAVTRDLRAVNGDAHLGIGYAPGAPLDRLTSEGLAFAGEGGGDDSAAVEEQARGFHYGLGKLELLTGNVGYAELDGFFEGAGAERMMLAALEYLRDADAVILDLRGHGGGSGDMSNWLLSHFLAGDSLLTLRVVERVNGRTVDRHTLSTVPGPRRPDVPLFILTSGATASAAEDFAFVLDNLGRAVLVGETTAGAGHNNALLGLGHGFVASISFSRVTDPASGREWERVGIAPDLAVAAGQALGAAHLAALDTIARRAASPPAARRLALLRETTAARYDPHVVPAERMRSYAGRYGDRHVTVEDGALRYRRGQGAEVDLIALSDSTFAIESAPAARLEFRPSEGSLTLIATQVDGERTEIPRDEVDGDVVSRLRAAVDSLAAAGEFSGVVVLARAGTPVLELAHGMADRSANRPNDAGTAFNLGSINKMFTAVAIMQLAEAGRVHLDSTISAYWPDYPNAAVARRVTLRQLLAHRSGIGGNIFGAPARGSRADIRHNRDFVPLFVGEPLQFEPGSAQRYSNAGFVILGEIVSRVSGEDYYAYVQRHVYDPAGMTRTGHYAVDSLPPNTAIGYTRGGGDAPGEGGLAPNTGSLPGRGSAAGGGYSTAGDLLRFLAAARDGRVPGARVAGIGVAGGAPGTNAIVETDLPGGLDLIVLTNLDPPAAERIGRLVREMVGAPE